MKKSGTPISLFSFQDIVTSLTGVMVIVILVIVLQLAEAIYDYENPQSDNPEYLELKAKMAELSARVKQLNEQMEEVPEELHQFVDVPTETMEALYEKEEQTHQMMKSDMEASKKEYESTKLSFEQLKEVLAKSKADKKAAEERRNSIDSKLEIASNDGEIPEMERTLENLKKEAEKVKNEIRITADKVEFSFKGIMSRQPILIECVGKGFRAQVYKSGDGVQDFTRGDLNANISSLRTWIRQHDLKKCYPVLLLRKSSFKHLSKIEEMFFLLDKDLPLGIEPLNDKVKVF